jgi:plasmid stability protein
MSVMLQVREVPDDLHRALKSRAALEGVSMSELVLGLIERHLRRPSALEINARLAALDVSYRPLAADVQISDLVREGREER